MIPALAWSELIGKKKRNLLSTDSLLPVPLTMAARAIMKTPVPYIPRPTVPSCAPITQRSLITTHRPIIKQPSCAACLPRAQLQQTFRRSYADVASPVTKRRGRGLFRWTWRLTYLSALGGVGYLAYNIYLLRTPREQYNPDPSKKTLVILGMWLSQLTPLSMIWY